MGFPCVAIKIPKSINVSILLNLLGQFKVIVMVALTHLGVFNTPPQANSEEEHSPSYVLVEWPTPISLVPIPVHILVASIKKRLPVVEYSEFLQRFGTGEDDQEDTVCSVCLSCVERSHEIRELSNCSHVFHRDCLDNWVNVGQVTCPLCRSMLLDMTRCGGSPWML